MRTDALTLGAGVALGAFLVSALLVPRERRHRRALREMGNRLREADARGEAAATAADDRSSDGQAAVALAEAHDQFHAVFDNAPIGMALVRSDGRLFRVNRALAHALGRPSDQLHDASLLELTAPDDRDGLTRALRHVAEGGAPVVAVEQHLVHGDGRPVAVAMSASLVRDAAGTPSHFAVQFQDLTDRVEKGRLLAHQATHDALTALPNRQQFVDDLGSTLASRASGEVALLFLDLDRFKVVNDSLGHPAGDRVLATIADRLRAVVGSGDRLARFAGDEFCVLSTDSGDELRAQALAARLMDAVSKPIALAEREVVVTASVGIALMESELTTTETLLRDATAAMHRAKELGRGRTELYESATHDRAIRHLRVANDLRRALEREELRVHYQPIVQLEDGRVTGFEALARWHHPERGLVEPNDFIDLAEETGLVVPLGAWVLEEACRQAVRWHTAGAAISMSVNLSPRQLAEPSLPHDVAQALARTGIAPDALHLEITESTLMQDAAATIEALRALHALGLRLSIDDFGTGFSSMSYLKRFPVDALKVDKSFVDGLGRDPEDTAICTAVVSLAHALGLCAVAEGVETPEQLADLRTLGCELAQGYLFGEPAPPATYGDRPDLQRWAQLVV
jgi:diguanylate cyclase (GGDEF)-like protein/PAS domain S-box-containing protein